jgi:hypothetical protein
VIIETIMGKMVNVQVPVHLLIQLYNPKPVEMDLLIYEKFVLIVPKILRVSV